MQEVDVIVLGAGIAGLSCARELSKRGITVRVLDRSPQLGGRCASRALGGEQRFDFGPIFVHGDDEDFLAWLGSLGEDLLPDWPWKVEGTGSPCQPQAFDPAQKRYGLRSGIQTLAERLATGVEVVREVNLVSLAWDEAFVTAIADSGAAFRGRSLVLALALEQTRDLLKTLIPGPGSGVVQGTLGLLGQFASLPCLTVSATYPADTLVPDWDVCYPEHSRALLMASRESSKRGLSNGSERLFTFQARPGWSAARLESPKPLWAAELLDEASQLWGPWAASPLQLRAHRWKYARLAPSDHLVRPLTLETPESSARLCLAGDLFDRDGGLQGAWRSGRNLARRLATP